MATRVSLSYSPISRFCVGYHRMYGTRKRADTLSMEPLPMVHEENPNHFDSRDFNVSMSEAETNRGCVSRYSNRNPRSMELIGIAEKPKGFKTYKWRVNYYHRLMLEISLRHISAQVNHNTGKVVAEASTKEFCISQHLYKSSDISAAYNIGRVLAHRCTEMGLTRMIWENKLDRRNRKVKAFIQAIHEGGIRLNEPKSSKVLPQPGVLP